MYWWNELWRTVGLGGKSLLLHKARSALTMLGVIFGVCSVIAMLAVGEGASQEAQEAIRRLGSTNILISSVKPPGKEQASSQGASSILDYGLTYADAWRIAQTVPHIKGIMPVRVLREDAAFGRRQVQVEVCGVLPGYADLQHLALHRGRFLCDTDESYLANVCVLNEALALRLFGYQDPLAQAVKLGRFYYRVVGLLDAPTNAPLVAAATGAQETSQVFIPLGTARSRFGETIIRQTTGSSSGERIELHRLIVQCDDMAHVEDAALACRRLLDHFHKDRDCDLLVPLQLLREAEARKRTFTIVLGAIAAISLLVGGIGIMNIMLATVTERTREIGIRRALGARRRDIVRQFLVETVVLSVGGGLIGVGLGLLGPLVVSELTKLTTIVTWWSLLLAFGVSVLVGVVFGLYPAIRAAALDPIEALRHE